jgi:HSF-type DNA-binding
MDALTTAVASSDDAALQSSPKKSPPESESDNEASTDVNDVSVVPVEEEQPTKNIIDEGDDRKSLYHDLLQAPPKPTNPSTKIKEPKFPMKLHMILSDPTYEHIISWLPHGRSWLIHDQKAFEQKVIPLFFRHGKFSSFARQVNGWGFIRVSHGPDMGSYYHEVRGVRWSSFGKNGETRNFRFCSSGTGFLEVQKSC